MTLIKIKLSLNNENPLKFNAHKVAIKSRCDEGNPHGDETSYDTLTPAPGPNPRKRPFSEETPTNHIP